MEFRNKKLMIVVVLGLLFQFTNASANKKYNEAFSRFGDWNEFNYQSNTGNLNPAGGPDGVIDPGGGGQKFDTEYLFYKYDANSNNLSIALQTGFDIVDGKTTWRDKDYYSGDLALSFDGNVILGDDSEGNYTNSYEYAVDFGLYTADGSGTSVESNATGGLNGIDPAGFYQVGRWNNDINYSDSSPFAMDWSENKVGDLLANVAGEGNLARTQDPGDNYSYWREVSFNLDSIVAEGETFTVDAHWTMSCGNDNINGNMQLTRNTTTDVPEPSVLALFGIGALGIFLVNYRRRKRI